MISLKIKTLDSQDHDFTVDDNITVREFKEHIASNAGVVADMQRLIYCGRVLNDEKLLRDYNVNGKVVHLVERAPPRNRNPDSRTETNNPSSSNNRNRDINDSVRSAPIFRALDGMVLGAMAIPMNANTETNQSITHSMNPSSTLCMNRITVARHMLDCVDNIVNYLENPERGLNNNEMDVLAQQTMESTVFEVGISAVSDVEVPQQDVQNFVQAFQGAVSAAFRQNGLTNIEMTQQPQTDEPNRIPTFVIGARTPFVLDSSGTNPTQGPTTATTTTNIASSADSPSANQPDIANEASNAPATVNDPQTSTPSANSDPNYQTTSTQTLAEVVQKMRTVQQKMEPFLQKYYDILQNDPQFAENETATREQSQRIFDRISEALHYFSHAQHAISDLMLELSLPAPRHLYCRPILVEQSAFVSSGFAVPNMVPTERRPATTNNTSNTTNTSNNTITSNTGNSTNSSNITPPPAAIPPQPIPLNILPNSIQQMANSIPLSDPNRQLHVARFIQAVVNSVPMYADVHVEISPRNSENPNATARSTNTTTNTSSTTTSTTTDIPARSTSAGIVYEQPRVTTVTYPTTSTQTRSTSRPQVHVTSLPATQIRNVRPVAVPAMQLSSFDRFLPCNSHHIRDNQEGVRVQRIPINRRNPIRRPAAPFPQNRPAQAQVRYSDELAALTRDEYSTPVRMFGSQLQIRDLINMPPIPSTINRIRSDLHAYTVRLFGSPLVETNMMRILQEISQLLNNSIIGSSQANHPSYDVVNSVNNLILHTLPNIVNIILEDDSADFAVRLLRTLILFVRRLLVILVLCVGRSTAQTFINEMTELGISPANDSEQIAIIAFKRHIRAAVSRQFDVLTLDPSDVQEFLVICLPPPPEPTSNSTVTVTPMETEEAVASTNEPAAVEIIDNDVLPLAPTIRNIVPEPIVTNQEPLPNVIVGSENWHSNMPTTWLPVITRDIRRQRRTVQQEPFSDAYLTGMSSKRRKIIINNKPSSTIPSSILEDSVRNVIQSRNGVSVVSVEEALASNPHIQEPYGSYEQSIRNLVQSRISRDSDFSAARFPNCSKWLNTKK